MINSILTATDSHTYISAELRRQENPEKPVKLVEVKDAFKKCVDETIKLYDVAKLDSIFFGGYTVSCLNKAGWIIVYSELTV